MRRTAVSRGKCTPDVMILGFTDMMHREDSKFQALFRQAGLQIVKMELQKGFPTALPQRLLPVKMYALKPKATE